MSEFKSHPYYFLHNFGQIIYPPWASVSFYAKVLSTTQHLGEIKCRLILAPNIRVIFNRYVTVNLSFIQQHLLQETKDILPLSTYNVLSTYTPILLFDSPSNPVIIILIVQMTKPRLTVGVTCPRPCSSFTSALPWFWGFARMENKCNFYRFIFECSIYMLELEGSWWGHRGCFNPGDWTGLHLNLISFKCGSYDLWKAERVISEPPLPHL